MVPTSSLAAASTGSARERNALIGGVSAGLTLMLVAIVVAVVLYRRKRGPGGVAGKEMEMGLIFPPADVWEYNRDALVMGPVLGQGEFGVVSRATAVDIRDLRGEVAVAVKQCASDMGVEDKQKFIAEAEAMKTFKHDNILRLLGVCLQAEPLYAPYLLPPPFAPFSPIPPSFPFLPSLLPKRTLLHAIPVP